MRDGFSEGLAAVMDEKKHWSYIDANGKIKIKLPSNCSNAQEFSEDLAAVSIGGEPWKTAQNGVAQISPNEGAHFGYIDKNGLFVIPPKYPCPKFIGQQEVSFKDGLAKATGIRNSDITFGVINRKGDFVIPPVYVTLTSFEDGLTIVDAGPVGFDPQAWAGRKHYAGPDDRRELIFLKFLRQYDIIGMSRSQLESLLLVGEQDHMLEKTVSYLLTYDCGGISCVEIRFNHEDKVDGYAMTGSFDRKRQWMTKSLKPRVSQSLSELFKENEHFLVE
jgi:hypothetical protein